MKKVVVVSAESHRFASVNQQSELKTHLVIKCLVIYLLLARISFLVKIYLDALTLWNRSTILNKIKVPKFEFENVT
jgi:H+/Cl- antiporter ClcA